MYRSAVFTCLNAIPSIQLRNASNVSRESNMLKKLLSGKRKTSWKWNDMNTVTRPKPMLETKGTPMKITSRRVTVLNKLFMRHITDLIANGQTGYELQGLGLVITRVLVCQHYHGLNVFWTLNTSTDFDYVEQKLESINKCLRHELCQMQLMGNVPYIKFVRDKQLSYINELDHLLSKADFGEDHETSNPKTKLESDFESDTSINDEQNSSLLPMRHDVFGLDHSLIMGRIKQSLTKSKQAWKAYEENKTDSISMKPFTFTTSFESIRKQTVDEKRSGEILQQFLQKRKLLRKLRGKSTEQYAEEFLDEEDENHYENEDCTEDMHAQWQEDHTEFQNTYDEYEDFNYKN